MADGEGVRQARARRLHRAAGHRDACVVELLGRGNECDAERESPGEHAPQHQSLGVCKYDPIREGLLVLKLIFLYGLPGVGKLTVARELAELTGYKLFHNHLTVDLVASVFEFGSEAFIELREAIWLACFSRAARAHLDGLIFTFAPDRTVRNSFIANVTKAVEQDGGEMMFVELTCSIRELERRIVDPARRNFGKLNSVERFRELHEAGAFVTLGLPAQRLTIETTEMAAPEAAERIVSSLKLKRSERSNIA